MNKAYLKRLIFRLFALVMAFGVVYSVQNPVSAAGFTTRVVPGAVRPQQGWYVRGTMTSSVSGTSREYFIIDTKLTDDPWYVEMQSAVMLYDLPYFSYDSLVGGYTLGLYTQFYPYTYWRGYSQVDWVLDNDWLMLVNWNGISVDNCSQFTFSIWDDSNTFLFTNPNLGENGLGDISSALSEVQFITGPGRIAAAKRDVSPSTAPLVIQSVTSNGSSTYLLDFDGFGCANPFTYLDSSSSPGFVNSNWRIGGVSINDLCFCIFPANVSSSPSSPSMASVYGRVAISFAIPVDKAPADTQVGDSWPKVQPLPVQIQGALDEFKAWKDNALAQTPVADPADVTSQIEGYNQQLDAADQWGTLESDAWNEIVPILDSFDFVFTILGIAAVVFVLLLFIKKGMA